MVTSTQSPPSANPRAKTALTKAWIRWLNGNKNTWYSYDTSGHYHVEDPREYGIRELKKRILRSYSPIDKAIIYDNQTGRYICELQEGQWIVKPEKL
jgi:hypothetical protein